MIMHLHKWYHVECFAGPECREQRVDAHHSAQVYFAPLTPISSFVRQQLPPQEVRLLDRLFEGMHL